MYYNGITRTMHSLRATTPPLYYKRPDTTTNILSSNNNSNSNNNMSIIADTNTNRGVRALNVMERSARCVVPHNEDCTYNHNNKSNDKNVAMQGSFSRNNEIAKHFSKNDTNLINATANSFIDNVNEYNDTTKITTANNNSNVNATASLMSLQRNSVTNINREVYSNTSRLLPPSLSSSTTVTASYEERTPYNNNNNNKNNINNNTKLFIPLFTTSNVPCTSRVNNNHSTNNNIRSGINIHNYTADSTTAYNNNDSNDDINVNFNTISRPSSGFAKTMQQQSMSTATAVSSFTNMRQGSLHNYNYHQQQSPSYKCDVYDMNADRLA